MKKRMQMRLEKLHISKSSRWLLMGICCLFLVFWTVMPGVTRADNSTGRTSKATNPTAVLRVDYSDASDAQVFWKSRPIPQISEFWQKLIINAKLTGEGGDLTDTQTRKVTYDRDTELVATTFSDLDKEKTYTLTLTSLESTAYGEAEFYEEDSMTPVTKTIQSDIVGPWRRGFWNSTSGENALYQYDNLEFKAAASVPLTYYRIITDSSKPEVNLGEEFLEFYQGKIEGDNNTDAGIIGDYQKKDAFYNGIVLDGGTYTNIYLLLSDFGDENGLRTYNAGEDNVISSDKQIFRIEMLTVRIMHLNGNYSSADASGEMKMTLAVYTAHNYEFDYTEKQKLEAPTVSTESGTTVGVEKELTVSKSETVYLENPDTTGNSTIKYYLSNQSITDMSGINWANYSDGGFVLTGQKYLYVMSVATNDSYRDSEVDKIALNYRTTSTAAVTSTPASGGSIDFGKAITLTSDGNMILYSMEDGFTFEKVSAADRAALDSAASGSSGVVKLEHSGKIYIRVNNLWYECSDAEVQQYSSSNQPVTDERLREEGYQNIYVQVIQEGYDLPHYQQLRYSYQMDQTTSKPTSTPSTGSTVAMLDKITLNTDAGSKVFYTVNGSVPIVNWDSTSNALKAGSGTYEYTSPIAVSESFASYGANFTITAQAFTYNESGHQTKNNSEVVRFTYTVSSKNALASVSANPSTVAEQPTQVEVGDTIFLYSSDADVTIFYTLDGTEPSFDLNTGECAEGTNKYDETQGVVVPSPTTSTQLIITAVACKIGGATSNFARFIYQYPGIVTAPYATPGSGTVLEGTEVALKTSTEGALIYYEIAYGNAVPADPTSSSQVFDAAMPIKINQNMTIKAMAGLEGIYSGIATFNYKVSDKLSAPTASITTGMMVPSGTVITLSADSGATIHYTLDGSDPTDSKNKNVLVGTNAIISGDPGTVIVLRAYATKTGYSASDTANYSYSVSAYAGGIYADRENGSVVKNGDLITLNTDMTDAEIYYTTDGTTPTEESHRGRTVTIQGEPGENFTIMAMALVPGTEKSNSYALFTYTIVDKLSAPTSSVPSGAIFTNASAVTLTAESGRIYYTTDGTDPTTASSLYKNRIEIEEAITIKAIAVADDFEQSNISTFTYGFADQVAAPIASYASGELEMGTKVAFSCETEGATIYYRTDGGTINLSRINELEIYTEPITINQATNFKVIAVKDKMQDSKILTVGYTVREPIVIESSDEGMQQNFDNQSNRLQSRRSFSDTESGPSYTDVVLRNASYGAIVAAEEGVLPDTVQLVVESTNVTDAVERRVKQVVNESFGVVASYDVTLLVNGEETQPEGTIEIGLPIPVEYENAMIYIVHVQEDGNIELFETRRSGGIAYAKVDHLSIYSITAPVEYAEEEAAFPWLPIMYTLAVALTGFGIWLIYKSKKEKREDGMQDV